MKKLAWILFIIALLAVLLCGFVIKNEDRLDISGKLSGLLHPGQKQDNGRNGKTAGAGKNGTAADSVPKGIGSGQLGTSGIGQSGANGNGNNNGQPGSGGNGSGTEPGGSDSGQSGLGGNGGQTGSGGIGGRQSDAGGKSNSSGAGQNGNGNDQRDLYSNGSGGQSNLYGNGAGNGWSDTDSAGTSDDSETVGIAADVASNYIPPEVSELSIPDEVAGRTGYLGIEEDSQEVGDQECRQIQNELGAGETGDGLTFDSVTYPYYAMLDDTGQHIYRQIYANAMALDPSFSPVENIGVRQLKNIFMAVVNDHPELFWMDTGYSCKYGPNGQCVEMDLKFNRTAGNLEEAKAAFEAKAEGIISQARNLSGDYEKEKYVHDALIGSTDYNLRAEMNQSAYSALVGGQTVCAGYARAFQYMMQRLGIPCYYCTGSAGEKHAWNIVSLDDGYYNVDATWDDTAGGNYNYFNKTDADYARDHRRTELSVYLPPCNGHAYRNLEAADFDSGLRSAADAGIAEDKVFQNLDDYYKDCYDQMLANGRGSYTFQSVIEGKAVLDAWYGNNNSKYYKQAYMDDALKAINASSCSMTMEIEDLQGDRYLITHKVTVR